MEPYSQTIAKFLCGLKLEDVPQAVVEKAKLVLLDTLGIALASSTMDFGRMVVNVAQKLGGPKSSRLIGSSAESGGGQRRTGQRHVGSWPGL